MEMQPNVGMYYKDISEREQKYAIFPGFCFVTVIIQYLKLTVIVLVIVRTYSFYT